MIKSQDTSLGHSLIPIAYTKNLTSFDKRQKRGVVTYLGWLRQARPQMECETCHHLLSCGGRGGGCGGAVVVAAYGH